MSDVGAVYPGLPQRVAYPYAANANVNIGDLIVLSGGYAVVADTLAAQGSAGADQAIAAPIFLGTAAERKTSTSPAGTLDVDRTSVSDRTIASGSARSGNLVTFREKAANAGLYPQDVALTTDPTLAIGRIVPVAGVDYTGSSVTSVRVEFFSRQFPFHSPGLRFDFGEATTATNSDTMATRLTKVLSVVANLEDAPAIGVNAVTGNIGDQNGSPAAGSFYLKSWKPTSNADPTPVAGTTFSKKALWIAVGY